MTTTTSQPQPKPKHTFHPTIPKLPTSGEVQGQCSVCHDLFTIYVYRERGELRLVENHRLKWMEIGEKEEEKLVVLIHRPGLCNGEVTLYGSLEHLIHQPTPHSDIARGTICPPAIRR